MIKNIIFSILSLSLLGGCSSDGDSNKPFIVCDKDSRGGFCTQEYKPVCAKKELNSKVSYETMSNGCNACLDHTVVGYTRGECESSSKHIWNEFSTKIHIKSFSYTPNPADREKEISFLKKDLSNAQLELLNSIEYFEKTDKNCDQTQDMPKYTITITDKDGMNQTYHSNSGSCSLKNGSKLIKFDDAKFISSSDKLESCTTPRPEVCTADVDPVCAISIIGSTIKYNTISNSCNACMNKSVIAYKKGGC